MAIIFAVFVLWPAAVCPAEKKVIGLKERVIICPGNIIFNAKVDTGAKHSSLDVSKLTEFERQGKKWIRFRIVNYRGDQMTMEKPVFRIAKIKEHNSESQKRYVIKLGICMGEFYKEVQCTLANRKGFNYRMLIGRSFFRGTFLVDAAKEYTTLPVCDKACEEKN